MLVRLLGMLAGILLLALVPSTGAVTAKTPTYVLTGGELGSHAYLLEAFIPDADGTEWVASVHAQRVDPPLEAPALGYDLYLRYGVFAIPYQMAGRGPWMRYYPELGLVQNPLSQRWHKPPAETVSFLDSSIIDALARMDAGDLDDSAFGADLRGRRMHEVTYSLFPYLPGDGAVRGLDGPGALRAECDACLGLIPNAETFVFEHLVETVSHTRLLGSAMEPAYTIEFHGWFGSGGIGGILGFYSLPADGKAGRFWMDGYVHDQDAPYYETTSGFDAAIEAALAGSGTGAAKATASDDGMRAASAAAALLTAVLGVGVVGGLVRRRG